MTIKIEEITLNKQKYFSIKRTSDCVEKDAKVVKIYNINHYEYFIKNFEKAFDAEKKSWFPIALDSDFYWLVRNILNSLENDTKLTDKYYKSKVRKYTKAVAELENLKFLISNIVNECKENESNSDFFQLMIKEMVQKGNTIKSNLLKNIKKN